MWKTARIKQTCIWLSPLYSRLKTLTMLWPDLCMAHGLNSREMQVWQMRYIYDSRVVSTQKEHHITGTSIFKSLTSAQSVPSNIRIAEPRNRSRKILANLYERARSRRSRFQPMNRKTWRTSGSRLQAESNHASPLRNRRFIRVT